MIRFSDKEVISIQYGEATRDEMLHYFLKGNREELICVFDGEKYLGTVSYASCLRNADIQECMQKEYAVLNETVWNVCRRFFLQHQSLLGETMLLPILNKKRQLVCFAWQDEEADREIRMLHELAEDNSFLNFKDLKPEYAAVTIHGCNELAWEMRKYLIKNGIPVHTEGELWQELCEIEKCNVLDYRNYDIWAEGAHQKSKNIEEEKLRSASVEFECINEIYEANRKAGRISDAAGDFNFLVKKLQKEKEIIILGKHTRSMDAYDLLSANGIDICAFCAWDEGHTGRMLLGKPVLPLNQIRERYRDPIFINVAAKYSAWGFGDVDFYDYIGYKRNKKYFLLRDYTEIPENNLIHILADKRLILAGNPYLCQRVYKWCKKSGISEVFYWDVLEENAAAAEGKQAAMPILQTEAGDRDICLLAVPRYSDDEKYVSEKARRIEHYIEKIERFGIHNYTDYFTNIYQSICIDISQKKYANGKLRPAGIVLGAIPAHSGNVLVKQCLAGHPQIMVIQEYGFLSDELYSVCIRLAEQRPENILSAFWELYQNESANDDLFSDNHRKELFNRKMAELLKLDRSFTSQELFVMFHIAYEAMFGREIPDPAKMVIYWEPHSWNRNLLRDLAYWLESKDIQGHTFAAVRNGYIKNGSFLNDMSAKYQWPWFKFFMPIISYEQRNRKEYDDWDEFTIKFEDLKMNPREEWKRICRKIGIKFHESLMETTYHEERAEMNGITGFDLKPVYNLYEKYFSAFDLMRITLITAPFQKKYGYPHVSCLDFNRRELQEMFLKKWRWEDLKEFKNQKDGAAIWESQKRVRQQLWKARFAEVENIDICSNQLFL